MVHNEPRMKPRAGPRILTPIVIAATKYGDNVSREYANSRRNIEIPHDNATMNQNNRSERSWYGPLGPEQRLFRVARKQRLSRTLFCSPSPPSPRLSPFLRDIIETVEGGGIRILTEIERAFSAGHIVIDVRDTEGVDRRLTHSNAQQGDEKYRQDHRGYFALYPLLRQRVAFALVHRVHLSRGRDPASRTRKKKNRRHRFEFFSKTCIFSFFFIYIYKRRDLTHLKKKKKKVRSIHRGGKEREIRVARRNCNTISKEKRRGKCGEFKKKNTRTNDNRQMWKKRDLLRLPFERRIFRSFLQFAEVGRNGMGVVRVTTLDPAEKHLVLMDQLFTEDEMGHRAGERAHREQDHAPSDPLRPVTLAPVIRKQERGTDLPDLRR